MRLSLCVCVYVSLFVSLTYTFFQVKLSIDLYSKNIYIYIKSWNTVGRSKTESNEDYSSVDIYWHRSNGTLTHSTRPYPGTQEPDCTDLISEMGHSATNQLPSSGLESVRTDLISKMLCLNHPYSFRPPDGEYSSLTPGSDPRPLSPSSGRKNRRGRVSSIGQLRLDPPSHLPLVRY